MMRLEQKLKKTGFVGAAGRPCFRPSAFAPPRYPSVCFEAQGGGGTTIKQGAASPTERPVPEPVFYLLPVLRKLAQWLQRSRVQ